MIFHAGPLVLTTFIGAFAGNVPLPAPPPPTPAPPSFELHRDPGTGGFRYDGGLFTARVALDGTVRFEDRHGKVAALLPVPLPLPAGTATLEGTLRGRPSKPAAVAAKRVMPRYDLDDLCDPRRDDCIQSRDAIRFTGRYDVTDEMVRAFRKEDVSRSEKARFMAATNSFRQGLAERWRAQNLDQRLGEVPARLDAIWVDPAKPVAQRRQELFAVWVDMDPSTPEGRRGATLVEDFIRKRLPPGSKDAYPQDELTRLSATAGRKFQPYPETNPR